MMMMMMMTIIIIIGIIKLVTDMGLDVDNDT